MAVGFPLLQAMISCLQNYYDKQNDSKHLTIHKIYHMFLNKIKDKKIKKDSKYLINRTKYIICLKDVLEIKR